MNGGYVLAPLFLFFGAVSVNSAFRIRGARVEALPRRCAWACGNADYRPADGRRHQLPGAARATTTYANWLSGACVKTVMTMLASKGFQDFANPVLRSGHAAARAQCYGLHFAARAFEIVVHHDKIIAARNSTFPAGRVRAAAESRLRNPGRARDSRSRSSREGGRMKMATASGSFSFTCSAPCTSISRTRSFFCAALRRATSAACRTSSCRRPGRIPEIRPAPPSAEIQLRYEIVPFAVAFRLARRARGARNRKHRAAAVRRSFSTSVDLPEPDGPETINTIGGGLLIRCSAPVRAVFRSRT